MKEIYLIFGYGIPKEILKDENYNFYLSLVFNNIYDYVVNNKIKKPTIIFSGGKTDCFKPFKRIESLEMLRWFKDFTNRDCLRNIVSDWEIINEKKSLSTLENFMFCKEIINKKNYKNYNINIFCEKTRTKRIKKLANNFFNKKNKVKIIPIDFDVSSNRYLPPDIMNKKEKTAIKYNLWALQSEANYKKYHKVCADRIKFLRQAGSKNHVKAVKEWWEKKLKEFDVK